MAVGMELHTLGPHLRDTSVDHRLFQLEVGNAIAKQSANSRRLLIDGDDMAGARKLLSAGQAGGARSNDGNALTAAMDGNLRLDPAFFPGTLDDGVLDRLDCDRRLAYSIA